MTKDNRIKVFDTWDEAIKYGLMVEEEWRTYDNQLDTYVNPARAGYSLHKIYYTDENYETPHIEVLMFDESWEEVTSTISLSQLEQRETAAYLKTLPV